MKALPVSISELQAAMRGYEADLVGIRHDLHRHPELGFEEFRTAGIVASKLRDWGLDVVEGLAKTGIVGTLHGRTAGRSIALRADMDALPIQEQTALGYASVNEGRMHACGHDGHTTMLLGAARYLAEHPDFAGTVHFIFQPAEEGLGGGRSMVNEGLFSRFPCDAVFGLHNEPGLEVGRFGIRPGPMLAAMTTWSVAFHGSGGHGGRPHRATDPTLAQAQFVSAVHSIVSRNVAAHEAAIVSVGHIGAGRPDAPNNIPVDVLLRGTIRTYSDEVHATVERRLREIAAACAMANNCTAHVDIERNYPAVVNTAKQARQAADAAALLVGDDAVDRDFPAITAAEDFAFMLQQKPGAFMLIGNGRAADGTVHHVHSPHYDFNDAVLTLGASYWVTLVHHILGSDDRPGRESAVHHHAANDDVAE